MLGLVLFTLYMIILDNVITGRSIYFHCYAVYQCMKPDNAHQFVKPKEWPKDKMTWMASHFLFLNSDETGV